MTTYYYETTYNWIRMHDLKKNRDITYTGLLYEPKENGQNTNLL